MLLRAISYKVLVLCVIQMHFIDCNTKLSEVLNKTRVHRQKRTLYFTYYSGFALDVLLSFPFDLPANNNAFSAFVFSANFFLPSFDHVNEIMPIPFTYIDEPGVNDGSKNRIELPPAYRQFSDVSVEKNVQSENMNTNSVNTSRDKDEGKCFKNRRRRENENRNRRKSVHYQRIILCHVGDSIKCWKQKWTGLTGSDCLLKAICETSESSFGYNNGVIGSVIDVLFLPSALRDEKLPKKYYRAETNGKTGNCAMYLTSCPKSIFEFVSQII